MRRAVIGLTGLLLAFLAGLVTLGVLLLAVASSLSPQASLDLVVFAAWIGQHQGGGGLTVLWLAMVGLCFLPVAVAALLGEAAGLRSVVWYGGAAGALAAATPTLARAALDVTPHASVSVEERATLLLFLTGVAAGLVYWLIAGRTAGAR